MIPQYIFIVNSYISAPKTSKPLILIARLTVHMPKIHRWPSDTFFQSLYANPIVRLHHH